MRETPTVLGLLCRGWGSRGLQLAAQVVQTRGMRTYAFCPVLTEAACELAPTNGLRSH